MKSLCRLVALASLAVGTMFLSSCATANRMTQAVYRTAANAPSSASRLATRTATNAPGSVAKFTTRTVPAVTTSAGRFATEVPARVPGLASRTLETVKRTVYSNY